MKPSYLYAACFWGLSDYVWACIAKSLVRTRVIMCMVLGTKQWLYFHTYSYDSDFGLLSTSGGGLVLGSLPYSGALKSSSATAMPVTGCS